MCWIIRIFFEVEQGLCPIQIGSGEGYPGFFHLSKVNLNGYIIMYLCSDLGLYRTDFWSLLCLYGIVLTQATLHNLIPVSYDISSWECFVLLISADLECP